jgi:hypothetical protein
MLKPFSLEGKFDFPKIIILIILYGFDASQAPPSVAPL